MCRRSSVAEQLFRKQQVKGSNPFVGFWFAPQDMLRLLFFHTDLELDRSVREKRGVEGNVVIIGRIPNHLEFD